MRVDAVADPLRINTATPEDSVEARLIRIWRVLLSVPAVEATDNFFDLGGDSILAVQLFAEIEGAFNVKLPVASLYDASTVAELARVIRGEACEAGWSPLVVIQPQGSRPPLFCFHGAGGNLLIYRDLARHLGPDQPMFGLQSRGLDGISAPLDTVEAMAALYAHEIRRAQPRGPYFLGGYCGGGTIAFEAAQQLVASGEQVALLALFDTMNWSKLKAPAGLTKLLYQVQRLGFHAANILLVERGGRGKFLRGKLQALRHRIPVWRGQWFDRIFRRGGESAAQAGTLGRIWESNDRACAKYVPRPYAGVVTDFRPQKQYRAFNAPDAKWGQLALDGQEVIMLPVYPGGMLTEPFVRHLAGALTRSIDLAMLRGQRTYAASRRIQ